MAGWKSTRIGELTFRQAETISWLPGVVQAFTTRQGGTSYGNLASLNMSVNVDDVPECVAENRRRAIDALDAQTMRLVCANQVHGDGVAVIDGDTTDDLIEADALLTDQRDVLLMMVFADCVPVFLCDPLRGVVGLVHSGWRGAVKDVTGKAVARMRGRYGVEPWKMLAAIGPCISGGRYEVGKEIVDEFWAQAPMLVSQAIMPKSDLAGTFLLNLRMIVFNQLHAAGLDPDNVVVSDDCTFTSSADYFSHRRDGSPGRPSGRMAGVIGLRPL